MGMCNPCRNVRGPYGIGCYKSGDRYFLYCTPYTDIYRGCCCCCCCHNHYHKKHDKEYCNCYDNIESSYGRDYGNCYLGYF